MPNKIISYTFPETIVPPFREVLYSIHELLDTVTVYRADQGKVDALENFTGIPRSKIVWGLAIGCNQEPFDDVSTGIAEEVAASVKNGGYAGVTTWSLNRDTDHRSNSVNGDCTPFQTGLPDGTYIRTIRDNLD